MKKTIKANSSRVLSLFLSIALIISTFAIIAQISVLAESAYAPEDFALGSGTEADPYQISTVGHLVKMVQDCGKNSSGESLYYKLIADIDLNPTNNWDPQNVSYKNWASITTGISSDNIFYGYLDGNYRTISHLYVKTGDNQYDNYAGLIQAMSPNSWIKNLTIDSFYSSGLYAAGVVGMTYGVRTDGVTNFENITVKNGTVISTNQYGSGAAGILSYAYAKTTFNTCKAIGLNITYACENAKRGAICGNSDPDGTDNAELTDCTAIGCRGVNQLIGGAKGNGANGTVKSYDETVKYAGGSGTKADPYQIATVDQLYRMVYERGKKGDAAAYYLLKNDIVFNETDEWSPDAANTNGYNLWNTPSVGFEGNFNGNGYTISNLYIKGNGFINEALDGAVITNVRFENIYVSGDSWVGALIGTAHEITVSNVMITNSQLVRTVDWDNSGGIVGLISDGKTATFSNCAVIKTNANGAISGCGSWNAASQNITGCWAVECEKAKRFCAGKEVNTKNSYFITDKLSIQGLIAKITMPNLDWKNTWKADLLFGYPELRDIVWNGKSCTEPVLKDTENPNSAENPYEIYSAAELYWLAKNVETATGYYALCSDIYLNDINDFSEEEPWWDTGNINKWYTSGKPNDVFKGHLEGNYHKIYGIYVNTDDESEICSGLFPALGDGAEINNLIILKSKLSSKKGYIGGIAGRIIPNSVVSIKNCLVDSSVDLSGEYVSGIVAAIASNANVTISNSAFTGTLKSDNDTGAIISKTQDTAKIKLVGVFAPYSKLAIGTNISYEKCYQTGESDISGLTAVILESMKGLSVKRTGMPELDFDKVWLPQSDDFPAFRDPAKYGVKGEVWDGSVAEDFALNPISGKRGNGTKVNPYIITTAAQLYRMMAVREKGAYYELAADIYLNDTSDPEWYNNSGVNSWFNSVSPSAEPWELHFDGKGYSINGLHCYAGGWLATGFIPVIGGNSSVINVHIRNSYYSGPTIAWGVEASNNIGGICGYVVPKANVIVGGCTVDSSVIFEGADAVGGIVCANAGDTLLIQQCGFSGKINSEGRCIGGIYGNVWASTTVKYCYSIGSIVGGKDDNVHATASFTYTTEDQTQNPYANKLNVIRTEEENFYSQNAESILEFDWNKWTFKTDYDYPFPTYSLNESEGIVGGIWSGNLASNYQPYTTDFDYPQDRGLEVSVEGIIIDPEIGDYYYGDGTDDYPYHIATGEQLRKMIGENCTQELAENLNAEQKSFLMVADIYLNDVNDPDWTSQDNKEAHNWVSADYRYGFRGHFNGDGHIVYGLRLVGPIDYAITGLIPVISEGAVVEKVGVVNAYINNTSKASTYAAGIAGYVTHYADLLGKDAPKSLTLYNVEEYGLTPPIVKECFAYDSYISASSAGGIVGAVPDPVIIEDCYFVGTVTAGGNCHGSIVANCWGAGGTVMVKSSYGFTTDYGQAIGGAAALGSAVKGGYTYTKKSLTRFKLMHPIDMYGESAYKHLPEFFADGRDVWTTVEDGTPVLSVFGERAKKYIYNTPIYSTVQFTTNVQDLILPSVTGFYGDPLTLPTPTREGYIFDGWYYYPELQCRAEINCVPRRSVNLFAKWIKNCVTQDFESYADSKYDIDPNGDYQYYKIGLANYDSNYVYGGSKSMHRIGNTDAEEDFLLNYEEKLVKGKVYKMTFWVCTDKDGTNATVSLVHNSWPDINLSQEPAIGVEKIVTLNNMKDKEWQQCTFTFTANSEWISIRTTGNASLYFDNFFLITDGTDGKLLPTVKVDNDNNSSDNSYSNNSNSNNIVPSDNPEIDAVNPDEPAKTNSVENSTKPKADENEGFNWLYVIIIAVAVIVVGSGVLVVFLFKRKKKLK